MLANKGRTFLAIFLTALFLSGCFKLFTTRLTDPDHCRVEAEQATNLVVECGSDEETAAEIITVER